MCTFTSGTNNPSPRRLGGRPRILEETRLHKDNLKLSERGATGLISTSPSQTPHDEHI